MKSSEALKAVMERRGVRPYILRNRLGMDLRHNSTLLMRLKHDNPSVATLNEMLRAMDYKLVIMPAETRMNSEWIELD